MSNHVKLFTGVCSRSELDGAIVQLDTFEAAFRLFLDEPCYHQCDTEEPSTHRGPRWRELRTPLRSLHAHQQVADVGSTTFASAHALTLFSPNHANHEEFLARSTTVLEDDDDSIACVDASLIGAYDSDANPATLCRSQSILSSDDSCSELDYINGTPITLRGPLTSIAALPRAAKLSSMRPQTVTVNVVVGVITASQPRTVYIKRGGYSMDIVELLVGDETKAGFNISVWLAPSLTDSAAMIKLPKQARDAESQAFRGRIVRLRTGDVLAIDKLALATFRDQVFGQSLHRRAVGVKTGFRLLHAASMRDLKTTVSTTHGASVDVCAAKLDRVRAWMERFVSPAGVKRPGPVEHRNGKRPALSRVQDEYLPPDSQ